MKKTKSKKEETTPQIKVKCPNCKTKFMRPGAGKETCGVCLVEVTMVPVKEKTS